MAKKPKREPKREERITMEVVVDCYGRDERALALLAAHGVRVLMA
jgi:hypothetical protein